MGLGKTIQPLLVLNFCGAVEALKGFLVVAPGLGKGTNGRQKSRNSVIFRTKSSTD